MGLLPALMLLKTNGIAAAAETMSRISLKPSVNLIVRISISEV